MKVNPEAQAPPAVDKNDQEEKLDARGGSDLIGFGNELYSKLIKAAPMLLPMLQKYGFRDGTPWFRKHWKNKSGGYSEFQFGSKSPIIYLIFFIDFLIKLIFVAIYIVIILAFVLVILRGLQLPEYVIDLIHNSL